MRYKTEILTYKCDTIWLLATKNASWYLCYWPLQTVFIGFRFYLHTWYVPNLVKNVVLFVNMSSSFNPFLSSSYEICLNAIIIIIATMTIASGKRYHLTYKSYHLVRLSNPKVRLIWWVWKSYFFNPFFKMRLSKNYSC